MERTVIINYNMINIVQQIGGIFLFVFYGPASAITVLYGEQGRDGKRGDISQEKGYIGGRWPTRVGVGGF